MIYPIIIALVWGAIPIIIKFHLSFLPHVFIISLQSLVLFISSLIYAYFFKYKDFMEGFKNVSYKNIFILALVFFIASFICNLLYLHVLKKETIISPLIIFILTPVITIILSSLLLNELLNIKQLIGCFLVSIGIILIVYYQSHEKFS
jgi:drug/metabolite transporter (DMT)-like permease